MKKEVANFIVGILVGLIIASFLSFSSTSIQFSEISSNISQILRKYFPSFANKLKERDSNEANELNSSISSLPNPRGRLIQERPNDPRLAFLKRKANNGSEKSARSISDLSMSDHLLLLKSLEDAASDEKLKGSVSRTTQGAEHKESSTTATGNDSYNGENGFLSKKSRCAVIFGERTYLKENQKKLPPLLYTFPGSGNTWCRLLIEYGTGIYSGSVYNDESLLKALPGEFTCNWQVSVVKAHPHTHRASELYSGHYNSDNNKCKRGNIQRFERSVLLIRDPFDSIWSEYQRRVSQSHVKGVLKEGFNWHRWQANAANLAHAYFDMWSMDHNLIERQSTIKDYLYIKYEDLKNKAARITALQRIIEFLRLPTTQSMNQKQLQKRLECAFVLAENREAHRTIDKSLYMTKDIAYKEEIACRMWSLFHEFASKHGYQPWNHFNCTGYPKIPRVNVGPQGDYDHRWIRPGQKLIDFRGKLFRNNTLILNPIAPLEDSFTPSLTKRQKQSLKSNQNLQQVEGTFEEIEKMISKKPNFVRRHKMKKATQIANNQAPATSSSSSTTTATPIQSSA